LARRVRCGLCMPTVSGTVPAKRRTAGVVCSGTDLSVLSGPAKQEVSEAVTCNQGMGGAEAAAGALSHTCGSAGRRAACWRRDRAPQPRARWLRCSAQAARRATPLNGAQVCRLTLTCHRVGDCALQCVRLRQLLTLSLTAAPSCSLVAAGPSKCAALNSAKGRAGVQQLLVLLALVVLCLLSRSVLAQCSVRRLFEQPWRRQAPSGGEERPGREMFVADRGAAGPASAAGTLRVAPPRTVPSAPVQQARCAQQCRTRARSMRSTRTGDL